MAWADLLTRTTGDWITSADMALIKSALQERTGWIGDSTEHTAADDLIFTQNTDMLAAQMAAAQEIVENICGDFARTELSEVSGYTFGSWSFEDLCKHVYDNHGGEASGMYHDGSLTWGWIQVPSRDGGSPDLGQAASGKWMYYEQLRGIAFAIDHLRWMHFQLDGSAYTNKLRYASKVVGYDYATTALAWAAMKSATPSITTNATTQVAGTVNELSGKYNSADYRALWPLKANASFLAGHTPTEWTAGKILIEGSKVTPGIILLADATDSAAGAYSTGSAFHSGFNLAAANTKEIIDIETPDNYPKADTRKWILGYSDYYDSADPGAIGHDQCQLTWPEFDMILKPATTYGT